MQDVMKELAGMDLSAYFPSPIGVACGMGTNDRMQMRYANATSTPAFPQAVHWSSEIAVWTGTELSRADWPGSVFLKKMSDFIRARDTQQISSAVNDDAKYVLPCLIIQNHWTSINSCAQSYGDLQYPDIRPL